jgi:hypothetical protein
VSVRRHAARYSTHTRAYSSVAYIAQTPKRHQAAFLLAELGSDTCVTTWGGHGARSERSAIAAHRQTIQNNKRENPALSTEQNAENAAEERRPETAPTQAVLKAKGAMGSWLLCGPSYLFSK